MKKYLRLKLKIADLDWYKYKLYPYKYPGMIPKMKWCIYNWFYKK